MKNEKRSLSFSMIEIVAAASGELFASSATALKSVLLYTKLPFMDYNNLLEDQIFMKGELQGRIGTALTILTDILIELNSLEIFYQKPSSKDLSPKEIATIRKKIDTLKSILQDEANS
ncbi:MAG: hypothetical protein ABI778_02975 [Ignavibacteriota bacterium]